MEEVKKRVRRTFGTIILQKFDAKATKIDAAKYNEFRKELEDVLEKFDKLIEESKKAAKTNKRLLRSLDKMTVDEIKAYLKTRSE